ncbi:glycosyltransferase family 4 protein [Microbacterium sp. BK668]|uniref:glycosyltransferase family 4 protein n=1 Tax=Microbacterium sp. BK668 TaxID=2512118 RepID=UPI00105B8453|nr:glycosyltransferase family 4 protein [Microbacterium sp. BK668]TDN91691.1 glycosyltransferase involved in cell wall biosynthesis [Microbacterium sp. BK668]
MTAGPTVWFVVPEGIDDPARVSGGNLYDLHAGRALAARGWDVRLMPVAPDEEHPPAGSGARPAAVASLLAGIDDDDLVLVDGLVAGRSAAAVEAEAQRLRIVVLAHMLSADFPDAEARVIEGERRAFAAARLIVTPSAWTRRRIAEEGLAGEEGIVVAHPGTDGGAIADGSAAGTELLCLGVVAPHKGQDVLVEALASLAAARGWRCTIAGSLETEPGFARDVRQRARTAGIADRVLFPGVLTGSRLEEAFRATDLVVVPSRVENFGMVVIDALSRGIPVVASETGGVPEATASTRAAILVPPGDSAALARTLANWLADPALRARLTDAARGSRGDAPSWRDTAERVAHALESAR